MWQILALLDSASRPNAVVRASVARVVSPETAGEMVGIYHTRPNQFIIIFSSFYFYFP